MPILNVTVSVTRSAQMSQSIASMLRDLTTRILNKKPELTAIVIHYVDRDDWIVGGRTLRDQNKHSFFFDIRVTDETNTKDEKAAYISAAFEGFRQLLGDLHDESYIHVHDVRAATYGYGGRTQEARYHLPG